ILNRRTESKREIQFDRLILFAKPIRDGGAMKRCVRLLIFLFAGLLLQPTFIPTASGGDCYSDCLGRYNCYSTHPYAGTDCYNLCRESCRPDGWGAIAYSWKDKMWGYSFALSSEGTAAQVAKKFCASKGGANCIVQATYYEACGAVAADGELVAWGTENTLVKAQQRAILECTKIGGKRCVVGASACSARNGTPDTHPASPPPPPKAIAWGAIAYSTRDMGAGWSQGKNDRASAEREAMSTCSQRGKACVLRTAFNKACG